MWGNYNGTVGLEYLLEKVQEWADGLGEIKFWIVVILGLIQCFFGYKLFLFYLWLLGAIGGAILSLIISEWFNVEDSMSIVFLLIGIFFGGMLFVILHKLGVFLIGGVVGVGLLILCNVQIDSLGTYIIIGIMVGIIAMLLEKHLIIFLTAMTGAVMVVNSTFKGNLLALFQGDFYLVQEELLQEEVISDQVSTLLFQFALIALVLAILGIVVQYKTTKQTI